MDSSVDVNLQIITVIIIICIPANVEYLCISVDIPAENLNSCKGESLNASYSVPF